MTAISSGHGTTQVIFDVDLVVQEMWQLPYALVASFGKWVPTLNGHRIHAKGPVLADPRALRLR